MLSESSGYRQWFEQHDQLRYALYRTAIFLQVIGYWTFVSRMTMSAIKMPLLFSVADKEPEVGDGKAAANNEDTD